MRSQAYVCNSSQRVYRQILQPFGLELEVLYARILGGKINPREKDCGRDIEFRDPTDPRKTVGVQVKAAYHRYQVIHFLAIAMEKAKRYGRTWTNFCIGDPPKGPDAEAQVLILLSFESYG